MDCDAQSCEAPGLLLALAPGGNLRLGARGGIEPQAGPGDGEQHHDGERQEQRPTPAARDSRT